MGVEPGYSNYSKAQTTFTQPNLSVFSEVFSEERKIGLTTYRNSANLSFEKLFTEQRLMNSVMQLAKTWIHSCPWLPNRVQLSQLLRLQHPENIYTELLAHDLKLLSFSMH